MIRKSLCWLSLVSCAFAQEGSVEPVPFDLAFSLREISIYERSVASPDGSFVVYAVREPIGKSRDAGIEADRRLMPGGTPVSAIGVRLFVTDVASGETRPLSREKTNSIRPSWSPDAKKIAFYCDDGGLLTLWVYDTTAKTARMVLKAPVKANIWSGDAPVWTPDGREVLVGIVNSPPQPDTTKNSASAPAASGPRVYQTGSLAPPAPAENSDPAAVRIPLENASDISFINIENGAARVVIPATSAIAPTVARLSPTGMFISCLSVARMAPPPAVNTSRDLFVLDTATGSVIFTEKDIPGDDADYFFEPYRWHPSDDRLFYFSEKRVCVRDFSKELGKDARKLAFGLGDADRRFINFTNDGSAIILALRPEASSGIEASLGVQVLLYIPLKTEFVSALSFPSNIRIVNLFAGAPGRVHSPDGKMLCGVVRDLNTGELFISTIHTETGAITPVQKGRFRAQSVAGAAPAGGAGPMIQFDDAATPGDIYQLSADLKTKRRITVVEPGLKNFKFGGTESFTTPVAAHDGSSKKAFSNIIFPPNRRPGVAYPVIVNIYGGARMSREAERFGGGSLGSMPTFLFTSRGFAVLFVDAMIGPEGVAGDPIQELKDCVLPQILHAHELGYIDIDRVGIMGQSYGGYNTASLLSATPLFKGGVAVSGIYDLAGNYTYMDASGSDFSVRWTEGGQGRMGTHPWADLKRYLDNSPYYRADRIHSPLLMIHGENDDTCPVVEPVKMYGALKRLGRDAELAIYPGEGHVVTEWSLEHAVDAARRATEFFGKVLRGD